MTTRVASPVAVGLALLGTLAACRSAPNLPVGERTCLGFPPDVCQREVDELEQEGAAHGGVVAYRILCTSGGCTADRGDGSIAVVFADGTGRDGGFGYAAPIGTPPEASMGPLPVVPVCTGVPAEQCDEFARTCLDQVADWSTVRTIIVRCTAACTSGSGDGETIVTLADGSTRTTSWQYRSGE